MKISRPSWLAIGLWVLLLVPFLARLAPTALDDVFITYRFSQNFAAGEGLVFNHGDPVFGLTEPGLGLLLGGVHRLTGLPMPWLGAATTAAGLLALALLLGQAGVRRGYGVSAFAAGTLLVSSTYLWQSRGTAAPIVLALLVFAARTRNGVAGGVVAGLAVWFRPDAGLGSALLACLKWVESRRIPWRFCLAVGVVTASGLLAGVLYYGTPLPMTLAAKRAASQWAPSVWPAGARFWLGFIELSRVHHGLLAWPLLILGILGQPRLWGWGAEGRILVLYAAGLLVAYPLLGVSFFAWYGTPIVVALLYGAVALLEDLPRLVERLRPDTGQRQVRALSIALLALLVLGLGARSAWLLGHYKEPSHLAAYRQAGTWLRNETPQRARVACLEIGVIGFTSQRPVLDLMGLVTPGFIKPIARGEIDHAVRSDPTEYLIDHTGRRVSGFATEDWFRRSYTLVAQFPDLGGGQVDIYRHLEPETGG